MSTALTKPFLGRNPHTFNLVYLAFLVLPWLFFTPPTLDIIVTLIAVAVFIPLHYRTPRAEDTHKLYCIAAIVAIGVCMAPFVNGFSVFHIYAAAAVGLVRPLKHSGIALALCTLTYVASGLLFERYLLEIVAGLVISIVVWVASLSDAELRATHDQAERERALDAQQASLVERERIARDLHDLLGHTLTLVSLRADLAGRLFDSDPAQAKIAITDIQSSSRKALGDVRAALSGLTATSIRQELSNATVALRAAGVELSVEGDYPDLAPEADTAIGLTIREATTNIVRHSSATSARIDFSKESEGLRVRVTDNGKVADLIEGTGLSGLRKRLEALGGMLAVSTPAEGGAGVALTVTLPA